MAFVIQVPVNLLGRRQQQQNVVSLTRSKPCPGFFGRKQRSMLSISATLATNNLALPIMVLFLPVYTFNTFIAKFEYLFTFEYCLGE